MLGRKSQTSEAIERASLPASLAQEEMEVLVQYIRTPVHYNGCSSLFLKQSFLQHFKNSYIALNIFIQEQISSYISLKWAERRARTWKPLRQVQAGQQSFGRQTRGQTGVSDLWYPKFGVCMSAEHMLGTSPGTWIVS